MDLEAYLQTKPKLYEKYEEIKKACEVLWDDVKLPWFTDHSPTHSARLVSYLNQILEPLEGTPHALTMQECFVILASCYLHDIGMQDLRCGEKTIESLTFEDFDHIRKEHAQRSYELIKAGVLRPNGTDSVDLRIEGKEEWSRTLMRVCKAHSTRYFEEMVQLFDTNPVEINNTQVRGQFLCALLMLADELDLAQARVGMEDAKLFKLSPESQVHWYTHYYTETSRVENQKIIVKFRLPSSVDPYAHLLINRVKTKLAGQLEKCNPIFSQATGGVLNVLLPNPKWQADVEELKKPIPAEVVELLLAESSPKEPEAPTINSFTPPVPSPLFSGREEERETLAELISNDSASRVSMIVGIGGTGKTQLVAKCMSEQKHYPSKSVFWFDISQQHTADDIAIALGYDEMLKSNKMPPKQKGVYISSAIENSGALIVIDNAHEIADPALDAMIEHAVSHLQNSRIILIGKSRTPLINRLEPKLLTRNIGGLADQGSEFARKLQKQLCVTIADDQLDSMCVDLDNHPLAIEVALRILRYGVSPDELAAKIVQLTGTGEAGEKLSKSLLGELHSRAGASECDLAYRLSVFRKPFPRKAVGFLAGSGEWEPHFNALIDKLMLRSDGGLFTMHPLVSIFCYEELHDKSSAHAGAAEYYKSCPNEKPDVVLDAEIIHHLLRSGSSKEAADILAEHGEDYLLWGHTAALQSMFSDIEDHGELTDHLLLLRGKHYELLDLYEKANEDFSLCETCRDDDIRAEAICRKGHLQIVWGNVQEAKQLFEQSRDIAENIKSERVCAYATHGIAQVAEIVGTLSNALLLHQKSLDFLNNLPNSKRSDIATAILDIGFILHSQGKYAEALEKHKAGLAINEEIGNRLGISTSLNNIGSVLHSQGKHGEALEKYEASLKISEEIGDRRGIAASLGSIGVVLRFQGKYAEALEKHEASLKIEEEIGNRQGIAASLGNMGAVLHSQGKYAEALEKHEASLKIEEEIGDRQCIAASLGSIGIVLDSQGKYAEALEKHEASLKIKEEIGNRQGISTSLGSIGDVLYSQGKYAEALKKYEVSLKISEEIGNRQDFSTSLCSIGNVLQSQKQYVEALKKYEVSLEISEEIGNRLGIATSLGNIGTVLHFQEKYAKALEYEKQAIDLCRRIESWANLAEFLRNIAYTARNLGDLPYTVSCLLEADALYCWLKHQIGMKKINKQIFEFRKDIGYQQFCKVADEAFANLPDHLKSYSGYEEYVKDPTIHRSDPKVGRNDPCPCGSGKKYKRCCGNK